MADTTARKPTTAPQGNLQTRTETTQGIRHPPKNLEIKAPPHSRELERACLGACLISPEIFTRLNLSSEDFYYEHNREIWLALDMLHEEGDPVDLHTVREVLRRRGTIDKVGGMAYLAALDQDLPSLQHAETYAKRVRECRRYRERIVVSEKYIQALYEGSVEIPAREEEFKKVLEEAPIEENKTPIAVDLEAFLGMTFPPRQWLVEGLTQHKDAGMIHAWRGVGKTHFALSLTWSIVCGGQFLRFNVPEPVGVLLIDGEMPREDLQRRLARIVRASDGQRKAPLQILAADMFPAGLPSLATPKGQAIVDANLSAFPEIKVVVVDNISTLCSLAGQAENDAESWNGVQDFVLRLRRRGISVIFVHHSNKNLSQRGTSKREDILSWVLDLRRPDDYEEEDGARFEMRFSKARAVHGEAAQTLDVRLVDTQGGGLDWTWKAVRDEPAQSSKKARQKEAVALLEGGMSPKEVAAELGVHLATVYRWNKGREDGDQEDSEV